MDNDLLSFKESMDIGFQKIEASKEIAFQIELDGKSVLELHYDGRIVYPGIPDEAAREFLESLRRIYPDWIKKNGKLYS